MKITFKKGSIIFACVLSAVILVYIILFAFVYDFVIVSGDSMKDTLLSGDLLIVQNVKYVNVDRGDIIVFDKGGKELVKRAIAGSNQTVEVKSNGIYVNDIKLNEDNYVIDGTYKYTPQGKLTVPYRSIYVLGDNRAVSVDSRSSSVSTVSEDNLVGVVVVNLSAFVGLSASEIESACWELMISTLFLGVLSLVALNLYLRLKEHKNTGENDK